MAQTKPDYTITNNTWTSLNTLAGVSIGTAFEVQNKGLVWVILQESNTQPLPENSDGKLLTSLHYNEGTATIEAGSLQVWAKASGMSSATVSIQEI